MVDGVDRRSGSPRRELGVRRVRLGGACPPARAANVPYQSATEKRWESAAPRRAGGTKPPLTKARTWTPPSYELNLPPLSGWLLRSPAGRLGPVAEAKPTNVRSTSPALP